MMSIPDSKDWLPGGKKTLVGLDLHNEYCSAGAEEELHDGVS